MATFCAYTNPMDFRQTITCLQADPVVEISQRLLEQADPEYVSLGDGIVTFHCKNGDITYGLREYDDLRETWIGVRSGVDDEDLEP